MSKSFPLDNFETESMEWSLRVGQIKLKLNQLSQLSQLRRYSLTFTYVTTGGVIHSSLRFCPLYLIKLGQNSCFVWQAGRFWPIIDNIYPGQCQHSCCHPQYDPDLQTVSTHWKTMTLALHIHWKCLNACCMGIKVEPADIIEVVFVFSSLDLSQTKSNFFGPLDLQRFCQRGKGRVPFNT